MKTLIIGAGPLGSLYTYLLHKAGKDVTLLAINEHYEFLKENGLVLLNEFTQEKITERVNIIDRLSPEDEYDLVIVIMRKNSVLKLLPSLSQHENLHNILFMGNNASGFEEYLKFFPQEKILFGFPGGGGSLIDHVAHYVDTEKPEGKRMAITIGEIDGQVRERTRAIQQLFESSEVPVKLVDQIDSWLKYHVAFVLPVAGALVKSGDNYRLAKDKPTIIQYVQAVREAGWVLKEIGYHKSYNLKLKLFYWLPATILSHILKKVFNSKFAEVAMMMHVNAAGDEMIELVNEFKALQRRTDIPTPNLDALFEVILQNEEPEPETFELENEHA